MWQGTCACWGVHGRAQHVWQRGIHVKGHAWHGEGDMCG